MADNDINIKSSVDTSALDELTASMKNIDNIFNNTAKNIAAFNAISQSAPKGIVELSEKAGVLDSEFNKLKASQINLNQITEQSLEKTRQLATVEKERAEALSRLAGQVQAVAQAGGPPVIPPSGPPTSASPGGEPTPVPLRVTRDTRIKEITEGLGVTEQLDSPAFERARSKINALAQAVGLNKNSLQNLEDAFQAFQSNSLDPTTKKVAVIINRLQDLERVSLSVAAAQKKAADDAVVAAEKEKRAADELIAKQKSRLARVRQVAETEARVTAETAQRREAAPGQVAGALGALGATPEVLAGLPAAKAEQVRTAIDRLNEALATGKLSLAQFNEAFNRVATGGFEALDTKARAAYVSLRQVNDILKEEAASAQRSQQINAQVANALKTLGISDREILRLDPARANAARVAINNLASALASGRIRAQDLDAALQNLTGRAITPLTGSAAVAAAQLGNLQGVVKGSGEALIISWQAFIRLLEVFLVRRVISALLNEFKNAIIEAIKFETTLTRISIVAGVTGDKLEHLSERIEGLNQKFGQPRGDVAAAAFQVFGSHITDAAGSLDILNDALNLSKTTFSTTEEAAKTLTNAIQGFGLSAQDSARVAQSLFGATTASRGELKDIEQVVNQTSIASRQLGLTLNEVLGAFVTLRERGLPADKAIQTLTSTFNKLVQSSGATNEIFLKLGFTSTQAAVKQLGLGEALKLISEEARNGAGRTKELADAFLQGNENINKLTDGTKSFEEAAKKFQSTIGIVADTSAEKFKKIEQNFKHLFELIGTGFKNAVVAVDEFFGRLQGRSEEDFSIKVTQQLEDIKNAHASARQEAEDDSVKTERAYRGLFAAINKQVIEHLQELRNHYQNHGAIVQEQFTSLSQLTKKITEDANKEIRASQASIGKFFEDTERKGFERRISILPPQQQFAELQQRLDLVRKRAQSFFAEGNRPAGEAAFKEAEGIILKFQDTNNKLSKDQVKQNQQLTNEFRRHLQSVDQIGVSALHLKGTDADRAKQLAEITKHLNNQLRILQQHANAYSNASVRANALNEIALRRLAVEHAIAEQQFQAQQKGLADKAKSETSKVQKEEEATIKRLKELEAERNRLIDQRAEQQKISPDLLNQLNQVTGQLGLQRRAQDDFAQPIQDVLEKFKDARESIEAFNKAPTTDNSKTLVTNVKEALEAFRSLNVENESIYDNMKQNVDRLKQDLKGTLDSISDKLKEVKSGDEIQKQLEGVNKEFETLRNKATGATGEIAAAFGGATTEAKGLSAQMQAFTTSVDASIGIVDRLTQSLGVAASVSKGINIPFAPAGGGAIEGRQWGGLIHGPGGIDNVPIRATAGEFVTNKESTERFYPILQAINSMGNFAKGGLVSNTSVGNISVNITSAGNEQSNLRNIGNALSREIRRGTIIF